MIEELSHIALWYNLEISVMVYMRVLVGIYCHWKIYTPEILVALKIGTQEKENFWEEIAPPTTPILITLNNCATRPAGEKFVVIGY